MDLSEYNPTPVETDDSIETAFAEYLVKVTRYRQDYPDLRVGQAFFNVLYCYYPDIADKIRGTKNDPFYKEDAVELALFLDLVWCLMSEEA